MVFILTVACAAGILALRCGCLPKEDAGQTVIEILDSPAPAEMKAHVNRITSGDVLKDVAKYVSGSMPAKLRDEMTNRLRRNLEVSADGPFITITVYEDRRSPVEMSGAVATSYEEDLIKEFQIRRQLVIQNLAAHITQEEGEVEKARLAWLDFMKKYEFIPDGTSPVDTIAVSEIAARLATARLELAMAGQRAAALQDSDLEKALTAAAALPGEKGVSFRDELAVFSQLKAAAAAPGAPPAAASKLKAQRDQATEAVGHAIVSLQSEVRLHSLEISTLETALKQHEQNLRSHQMRRSEMDTAKEKYERQLKLLNGLKEESMDLAVKNGVRLRPVRVVEEAHPAKVPDRRIRKFVRLGVIASATLLAASLLSAFASRLCRHGP